MRNHKLGVCVNCARANTIEFRGLCGPCYWYEARHGEPKPPKRRLVDREEFIEEWEHMTRKVGYPVNAAIYRLADAFGMSEDAVRSRLSEYGLVAA